MVGRVRHTFSFALPPSGCPIRTASGVVVSIAQLLGVDLWAALMASRKRCRMLFNDVDLILPMTSIEMNPEASAGNRGPTAAGDGAVAAIQMVWETDDVSVRNMLSSSDVQKIPMNLRFNAMLSPPMLWQRAGGELLSTLRARETLSEPLWM